MLTPLLIVGMNATQRWMLCQRADCVSWPMDFTEAYTDTCSSVGLAARLGDLVSLQNLIWQGKSIGTINPRLLWLSPGFFYLNWWLQGRLPPSMSNHKCEGKNPQSQIKLHTWLTYYSKVLRNFNVIFVLVFDGFILKLITL